MLSTTKTTMTIERGNVVIETNHIDDIEFEMYWDMFIVPNQYSPMNKNSLEYYNNRRLFSALTELHFLNGTFPNFDDRTVMVWYTNDLTQNLVDHMMLVIVNGKRYIARLKTRDFLTESIARMFHEGETTTLNMVLELEAHDPDAKDLEVTMIAHITPRQQAYRYASFGTWDDVLDYVTK